MTENIYKYAQPDPNRSTSSLWIYWNRAALIWLGGHANKAAGYVFLEYSSYYNYYTCFISGERYFITCYQLCRAAMDKCTRGRSPYWTLPKVEVPPAYKKLNIQELIQVWPRQIEQLPMYNYSLAHTIFCTASSVVKIYA